MLPGPEVAAPPLVLRALGILFIPWIGVSFGCFSGAASSPASNGSPTQTASLASDGGSDSGNSSDDVAYPDAAPCGETPITFELTLPTWSTGSSFSCLGDPAYCPGSGWLTIASSDGGAVMIGAQCGAVCSYPSTAPSRDSGVCAEAGAPIFVPGYPDCICESLSSASSTQTRTWDGTVYTAASEWNPSVCTVDPFDCWVPSCAAPGDYIATMCAGPIEPDAGLPDAFGYTCSEGPPPDVVCTQVMFEWPPSASGQVVSGTLSIVDGG